MYLGHLEGLLGQSRLRDGVPSSDRQVSRLQVCLTQVVCHVLTSLSTCLCRWWGQRVWNWLMDHPAGVWSMLRPGRPGARGADGVV